MEQKQPLQQMVLGELESYVQKNETRSPTYALQKNKLKCPGTLMQLPRPRPPWMKNKSTKT